MSSNSVFSAFGNRNQVYAEKGPGSVAGSIGGNDQTVIRDKPGITVNRVTVP